MQKQSNYKRYQWGFSAVEGLLTVLVLAAIGLASWYLYAHVWHGQQVAPKATPKSTNTQSVPANDGWSRSVTSGKGAFRITFPDGWHVSRDTNSDAFMIGGEAQPEMKFNTPATVTSAPFGSDGSVVLFITLSSDTISTPQGTASDYLLENGKVNPIQGKKYVYEYPADQAQPQSGGIGAQRLKGDRDYTYLFDVGNGKHLQVFYSVYASDPRNNIEIIDALVRTIRLNP